MILRIMSGNLVKQDEIGRACSMNGGEEECIHMIFVGKPGGK
jgi:hypothetical protein